ncbi:MAG TPA: lipid A deacylase LpxR family protein [Gammaproteobacteria bacterium]
MDAFHALFGEQRKLVAAAVVAVALFAGPAGAKERTAHVAENTKAELDVGSTGRLRPRGWTVHLDNDLFAFTDDDRDYTAGISVTLGGREAAGLKPLSRALDWVDRKTGFGTASDAVESARSFEAGLLLFTPQNLDAEAPLYDDRPYANLTYLSSSRLTHDASSRTAYQSSLTVGVLGMPWVEHLHRTVHVAFGSREPKGYTHQISDGGEPTARYAVSRYRLLGSGMYRDRPYHLRFGLSGSIGYLTEASADLAFRWGNLDTPWWSSSPSLADYGGHPPIRLARESVPRSGPRLQLAAGVSMRVRAYNAFLQGQFRSSDVTLSSSRLNPVLLEAWLGITAVFKNHLSVTYTLRHQTEEIRTGDGSRESSWASIGIAQQF